MTKVEKAGMLVNTENEVIGWFNVGDDVELKNGDTIVSHHKTAEKKGLLEQFNKLKAENAPAKEKKTSEKGESARARVVIPAEGAYEVVTTKAIDEEDNSVRMGILKSLLTGNDFATFWANNPQKFEHPDRDGAMKEFTTKGLVSYAIRRGMIKPV